QGRDLGSVGMVIVIDKRWSNARTIDPYFFRFFLPVSKIIIPTVYRENYMGALRKLKRQRIADRYVTVLFRAYEFSSTINSTLSISCGDLPNVNSIKILTVLMNGTRDFLFVFGDL